MATPVGLYYYPEVIPDPLGALEYVESLPTFPAVTKFSSTVNTRRVAHFGYTYDYKSGSITTPADPFTEEIQELADLISDIHDTDQEFNQCIINRYLPGQGISTHLDRVEYGAVIACYTVGGGAEMEFTRPGYKLYTEPGSLYIMSGESRYKWRHQMRSRKSDPGHGKRDTRWSLTFRHVPL